MDTKLIFISPWKKKKIKIPCHISQANVQVFSITYQRHWILWALFFLFTAYVTESLIYWCSDFGLGIFLFYFFKIIFREIILKTKSLLSFY